MSEVSPETARASRGERSVIDTASEPGVVGDGFVGNSQPSILGPRPLDLRLLVNPNDILPVSFLTRGAKAADAVGRIVRPEEDGNHDAVGTGFLIADDLLLTNWHVLRSVAGATGLAVQFGYERDGSKLQEGTLYDLDPERLFVSDRRLDYAVVAVAPRKGKRPGADQGTIPLTGDRGQARIGSWVNIIQHPDGEPKSVVVRENQVVGRSDDSLYYTADTLGGSSGSAVLSDEWELVALHRSGADLVGQGLIANTGVRASAIVRDLRDKLRRREEAVAEPAVAERLREVLGLPKLAVDFVQFADPKEAEMAALREWLDRLSAMVGQQEERAHLMDDIDPARIYAAMNDYGDGSNTYGPARLLDLYAERPGDEHFKNLEHALWHACGGRH